MQIQTTTKMAVRCALLTALLAGHTDQALAQYAPTLSTEVNEWKSSSIFPSIRQRMLLDHRSWPGNFGLMAFGADVVMTTEYGSVCPGTIEAWSSSGIERGPGYSKLKYQHASGARFSVTASRLSPAILIESTVGTVRCFTGEKPYAQVVLDAKMPTKEHGWGGVPHFGKPPYLAQCDGLPEYYAFPVKDGVRCVARAELPSFDLSSLAENWCLCWYGDKSYFTSSKAPLFLYAADFWNRHIRKVDNPWLLVFSERPTMWRARSQGDQPGDSKDAAWPSLSLEFGGKPVKLAMTSLYGFQHPEATDTARWKEKLPAPVLARCRSWYRILGFYPLSVSENYAVSADGDEVSVTNSVTFVQVRGDAKAEDRLAPLPPLLCLAADEKFPVTLEGAVVDTGMRTFFGPYRGVHGEEAVYRVKGLNRYVDEYRQLGTADAPAGLTRKLAAEMEAMLKAGHLAPWYFHVTYQTPYTYFRPIWSAPGDVPWHLSALYPVLPDGLRKDVQAYITDEMKTYGLFTSTRIPYDSGTRREFNPHKPRGLPNPPFEFLPLNDFYALASYESAIGDKSIVQREWESIKQKFASLLPQLDWAILSFSNGNTTADPIHGIGGIVDVNRLFNGAVGFTRLARTAGDKEAAALGRFVLARAMVSRFAMGKFVAYAYREGMQSVPNDPNWMDDLMFNKVAIITGQMYMFQWNGPEDDVRQLVRMDRYGPVLHSISSPGGQGVGFLLSPFFEISPELGRFLGDHLKPECRKYLEVLDENWADWYMAWADGVWGTEGETSFPESSYYIFLGHAWVMNEDGPALARYIDVPWVRLGDLYYFSKLAETIKAYRGARWERRR